MLNYNKVGDNMLDIEKNKELFLKKYQYYNQRINTVEYPKEELEKITKSERC